MHSVIDVTVAADAVFVSVTLDNTDPVPQRVRLRNRLDGPVLPPRRAGVPEPGWNDEGFEGVVPAESTISLGYACPVGDESTASSDLDADAVVSLDVLGRDADFDTTPTTPADAIRQLGPARPPADAVPTADAGDETRSNDTSSERGDGCLEADRAHRDEGDAHRATERARRADVGNSTDAGNSIDAGDSTVDPGTAASPPEPTDGDVSRAIPKADPPTDESMSRRSSRPAHSSFLVACERRIELAERLDGGSVRTAATALEDAAVTVDAIESLDADRQRLRRLAARATELADRAADADPNVDALRSLA